MVVAWPCDGGFRVERRLGEEDKEDGDSSLGKRAPEGEERRCLWDLREGRTEGRFFNGYALRMDTQRRGPERGRD